MADPRDIHYFDHGLARILGSAQLRERTGLARSIVLKTGASFPTVQLLRHYPTWPNSLGGALKIRQSVLSL